MDIKRSGFQIPLTIKGSVESIHERKYLLPAIRVLVILAALIGVPESKNFPSDFLVPPASAQQAQVGEWEKMADMITARSHHTSVNVDGIIYNIGGVSFGFYKGSNEAFDPETNTWGIKKEIPEKKYGMTAQAVNGKIYTIGGGSIPGVIGNPSVHEYNPATDSWERKADLPRARVFSSSAVIDGKIWVFGGLSNNANDYRSEVEVYDPATETWEIKKNMPQPAGYQRAIPFQGKIYFVGGLSNNTHIRNVWNFDPTNEKWDLNGAPIPTAVSSPASNLINSQIYVFGGWDGGRPAIPDVQRYDPVKDEWTLDTEMPEAKTWIESSVVNNIAYVFGGKLVGNPASIPTVYAFKPGNWTQEAVSSYGKKISTWGQKKLGLNRSNP